MMQYKCQCNRNIVLGAILAHAAYTIHVDHLAAQIASGRLKPGDRLPPQRTFAYERGIAASTAARVYAELLRRGLTIGEVGRGTFIAGANTMSAVVRSEPLDGRIDLDFNFPTIPQQPGLMAKSLAGLHRADVLAAAMAPVTKRRLDAARSAVATLGRNVGWRPNSETLVFTGCGRQSIAASISALVPVGGRLAVEAISYPMVKGTAARLGVTLVPIAMDEEGIRPDLIARAHRAGALSAIYLQPVMHNPLGRSMSAARRDEIVRQAAKLDLYIIEDFVYGFLGDTPPLAIDAPDRCLVADSLSKRVAAGAALGWLSVPKHLQDRVASAVRTAAWHPGSLALEIGTRMIADGTVSEIGRLKQMDAKMRQTVVAEHLEGFDLVADPRSYHVWLKLPEGWRSETFTTAAARAGVSITPSSAFAMTAGHAPNAVRLALGLPTMTELRTALERLATLLRAGADANEVTE